MCSHDQISVNRSRSDYASVGGKFTRASLMPYCDRRSPATSHGHAAGRKPEQFRPSQYRAPGMSTEFHEQRLRGVAGSRRKHPDFRQLRIVSSVTQMKWNSLGRNSQAKLPFHMSKMLRQSLRSVGMGVGNAKALQKPRIGGPDQPTSPIMSIATKHVVAGHNRTQMRPHRTAQARQRLFLDRDLFPPALHQRNAPPLARQPRRQVAAHDSATDHDHVEVFIHAEKAH